METPDLLAIKLARKVAIKCTDNLINNSQQELFLNKNMQVKISLKKHYSPVTNNLNLSVETGQER